MSSTLGIIFNPSADAVTVHNQTVNDIDPYSHLDHRKPVLILPKGLSKPEDRAPIRNEEPWVGFKLTTCDQ